MEEGVEKRSRCKLTLSGNFYYALRIPFLELFFYTYRVYIAIFYLTQRPHEEESSFTLYTGSSSFLQKSFRFPPPSAPPPSKCWIDFLLQDGMEDDDDPLDLRAVSEPPISVEGIEFRRNFLSFQRRMVVGSPIPPPRTWRQLLRLDYRCSTFIQVRLGICTIRIVARSTSMCTYIRGSREKGRKEGRRNKACRCVRNSRKCLCVCMHVF